MSSNTSIKNQMIKKYGKRCFIEELKLRDPEEVRSEIRRYTSKGQRAQMDMLTYHHIVEKCRGGRATEANGAILRNINHMWFNRLSRAQQAEINELFQEYKRAFKTTTPTTDENKEESGGIVLVHGELRDGSVRNVGKVAIELEMRDYIYVPLYETTEEEYEKYIKARREKQAAKWGKSIDER